MELYESEGHYIVQDEEYSLWCDRRTGHLEARTGQSYVLFAIAVSVTPTPTVLTVFADLITETELVVGQSVDHGTRACQDL